MQPSDDEDVLVKVVQISMDTAQTIRIARNLSDK
jgi:hypothetical protein